MTKLRIGATWAAALMTASVIIGGAAMVKSTGHSNTPDSVSVTPAETTAPEATSTPSQVATPAPVETITPTVIPSEKPASVHHRTTQPTSTGSVDIATSAPTESEAPVTTPTHTWMGSCTAANGEPGRWLGNDNDGWTCNPLPPKAETDTPTPESTPTAN